MCSTLKWVCICLQGHLGVFGHLQAPRAARPPAQQITVARILLPMAHAVARAARSVQGRLFAHRRWGAGLARRRLRKRGQSKISLWRCALRTEGRPEF
jgi:hypothetical protein